MRITKLLCCGFACLGAILPQTASAQSSAKPDDEDIRRSLQKIAQVYHLASTQMAEPAEPEKALFDGAIRGALSSLDPFTTFLDSDQFAAMQQQERGVQTGFGAILNVQSGSVTVLQSVPGSPFGKAGLGPGDRILRIDGHRIASMDLQELVAVLQEAKTHQVRLSVLQSGKVVPEEFDLSPIELTTATVDKKFLLSEDIGYLHVAMVESSTPVEIQAALEAWKGARPRGVILDLRDNPGGLLEAAVSAVSLFLRQGQAVVSLQGRAMLTRTYAVESPPLWSDLPLVVLINGRSASAAEIIAAALQEHDRAWVVGEPSFGKGVVESVMPLSGGAALALTTARYFTPQGRSVQRPVPGTALADVPGGEKKFFSDSGRPLAQQGGVQPDQEAASWRLDQWANLLGQSTVFMNFAQSYIERYGKVNDAFQVDDSVLDEFQRFLRESGLPIPPQSWIRALPFLKVRIKTELFNLVFGAFRGDQVEVGGDPQVIAAGKAIYQAQQLFRLQELKQGTESIASR